MALVKYRQRLFSTSFPQSCYKNGFATFSSFMPSEEETYTDRKSRFTNVALAKAKNGEHPDWLPELGYAVNRPRMIDLYAYYRDLSLSQPDLFLWAGLGHMAGAAVIAGLDSDPGFLPQPILVRIARDVFFDLIWMHEMFLADPDNVVMLADLHGKFNSYPVYNLGVPGFAPGVPRRSYGDAWRKILSGDPAMIAEGNRDLLENEQFLVIQPHYDFLATFFGAGLPTPFTNEIHPYHRAFIVEMPQRNILVAEDRWAWITHPDGMFQRWNDIGAPERTRLINLDFDQISRGDFGVPGRPELLPPGGP